MKPATLQHEPAPEVCLSKPMVQLDPGLPDHHADLARTHNTHEEHRSKFRRGLLQASSKAPPGAATNAGLLICESPEIERHFCNRPS